MHRVIIKGYSFSEVVKYNINSAMATWQGLGSLDHGIKCLYYVGFSNKAVIFCYCLNTHDDIKQLG